MARTAVYDATGLRTDAGGETAGTVILDGGHGTTLDVPGHGFLTAAEYERHGPDLVLVGGDGHRVLVTGYFANPHPPVLVSAGGAAIAPELAARLAGPVAPGQIAQAGGAPAMEAVGTVSKAQGTVEVMHPDGTKAVLHQGDAIHQGDVISTRADGAVAITFADSSSLSLGKSGRMVIDELVYDPSAQTGHQALSVVQGAFSLVSGHIAKSAPDAASLKTPVMTIGIRGTSVAGTAGAEGEANTVVLLQDPDGNVGQVLISTAGGMVVLDQPNFATTITSFSQPPTPPVFLPPSVINSSYGDAIGVQPSPPTPTTQPPASQENGQQQQGDAAPSPADTPQQTANAGDSAPVTAPPAQTTPDPGPTAPVEVPPVPVPPTPDPGPVRTELPRPPVYDTSPRPQPPEQESGGQTNLAPTIHGDTVALFVMNESTPPSVTGTLYASDPEDRSVTSTYTQTSTLGGHVTITDDGYGTLSWLYVPPTGTIAAGNDQDSFTVTVTDADGISTTQVIKLYANLSPNANDPTLSSGVTTLHAQAATWTTVFRDASGGYHISAGDSDSTYVLVKITLKPGPDDTGGQIRCTVGSETITSDGTITFVTTAAQVAGVLETLQYRGSADEADAIGISISDDGKTWVDLPTDVDVTVNAPATSSFTGAASQDFTQDANWNNGRPGDTTDATIAGKTVVLSQYDDGHAASLALTTGASLSIVGDLRVESVFSLDSTSTLAVSGELQAGTIELHGAATVDGGYLTGQEAIRLYGTTTVVGYATFSGTTTHVDSGATLTVDGHDAYAGFQSLANEGTLHLVDGATAAITGSGASLNNSGLIWGDGTLDIASGSSFVNDGILRPGGDNETGHLTITGSAGLGDSSVIEMEFDGTSSHDVLTFDSLVSLNGSLSLDIDPAATPYGYEATPTAIITGTDSASWFDTISLVSTSNGNGVVGVWHDGTDVLAKSAVFANGQTATYTGSGADETIFGARDLANSIDAGGGGDTIYGGAGNDILDGGGGADAVYGGNGNDVVVVRDLSYATLDGGAGIDTLKLETGDTSLDLSGVVANNKVSQFEVIDLSAIGLELSLDWASVSAVTGGGNDLIVNGGADDAVHFGDGANDWVSQGPQVINGHSYEQYVNTAHGVTVNVASEITTVDTTH